MSSDAARPVASTTFASGRRAEAAAANYLRQQGFDILTQNYRTRSCEIDIVACHEGVTYFVEVKYRATDAQGSGLEYITPRKLKQMAFAAVTYRHAFQRGGPYQLAAIEVSGADYQVTTFLDSLT